MCFLYFKDLLRDLPCFTSFLHFFNFLDEYHQQTSPIMEVAREEVTEDHILNMGRLFRLEMDKNNYFSDFMRHRPKQFKRKIREMIVPARGMVDRETGQLETMLGKFPVLQDMLRYGNFLLFLIDFYLLG